MKRLFLFLFLLSVTLVKGQDNKQSNPVSGSWGTEVRLGYGFIIAHRESLMPLQEAHLRSAEIAIIRRTAGKKEWENRFLCPEKGIQLEVIDPGSPDKLGTVTALYPFVDFPLQSGSRREWWFRYGMGLGYVQKTFDPIDNYKNAAIGSHLNGVLHLDLQYRTSVGKSTSISIGLGITHLSNGSTRMPNLGINLPKATVGVRRYFGPAPTSSIRSVESKRMNGSLQCYIAGGLKETYPALGSTYSAATFDVLYALPTKRRSNFGIGTSFFYDQSLSVRQERLTGEISPSADFRPGIYGAWQMRLGDIGIAFNMGFYPYTLYKEDGNFYHRIGFRYYVGKLFLCSNLKTHYARADFIEWGIGWQFEKK